MSSRPTVLPPRGAGDVLYLIDLSGFVYRAYHALVSATPMSSPRGEPTGATYGTVAMLQQLIEQRQPQGLVDIGVSEEIAHTAQGQALRLQQADGNELQSVLLAVADTTARQRGVEQAEGTVVADVPLRHPFA